MASLKFFDLAFAWHDFIAAADARLYQAKQAGRNRIVVEPLGEKTEPFTQ